MENLPIYDPHPQVCHMEQYHCCKRYQQCRLYPICSQIQQQTVCQRDCPSCSYAGCSLPKTQRQTNPVYIQSVIQGDRKELDIEKRYLQEHEQHRIAHRKSYVLYNKLFGNLKEKLRNYQHNRYWADIEYSRKRGREKWAKAHPPKEKAIPEKYLPECELKCKKCPYPDCILPENWREIAVKQDWLRRNPDYYSRYYQSHKPEIRAKQKEWYQENREKIREQQRLYRLANPDARDKQNAYQRAYYEAHKEEINQRRRMHNKLPEVASQIREYQKAYRETHREEKNERERKYYAEHKDRINEAQRRNRQKPERKEQRATYDKQYRKDHPEVYLKSSKKYRQAHPEKVRETHRAYYQKHKDEINAKRREKRNGTGKSTGNITDCEM